MLGLFVLISMISLVSAQVTIWEETFSPTPTGWNLEGNWTFQTGNLRLGWSPTTTDYDMSATSPAIQLPATVGDVIITQYYDDYSSNAGEMLEIIAVHEAGQTVLWEYTTSNGDWGVTGGQNIDFSLAQFANHTIQLKFRSYGGSTFNINYWYIYNIAIMGSINNDLAAIAILGDVTPSVSQSTDYTVKVRNNGLLTQSNYTVRLMQSGNVVLYSLPGQSINQTQIIDYVFTHAFTSEGPTQLWGEVVFAADELPANNTTAILNLNVQPSGTAAVVIGNDTTSANTLPLNFYWKNSISQVIYMAEELNIGGMLTAIMYKNNFTETLNGKAVKMWIAETELTSLTTWLPYSEFTQVFDGVLNFPTGQNDILIPLDEYYAYGGSNLVVMVNRVMEDQYWASTNHFYYTETPAYPNRALWYHSDTNVVNPENIAWPGTAGSRVPNTTLYFATAGMGSLDGYVYRNELREPLAGVEVKVLGTNFTQFTNTNGFFNFPYVFEGTYNIQATLFGHYDTIEQNVTISENELTSITIYMQQYPTVNVSGFVAGSDYPEIGLAGAVIQLTGYDNFEGVTSENGYFTIGGVYADNSYNISISYAGYTGYSGVVTVGNTDLNAGTFILNEIASAPRNVIATHTDSGAAEIIWSMPGAGGSGTEQWIYYDNGENQDAIGTGGAADFDVAIRFVPEQLEDFNFMYLTKVRFYPYEANCQYSIRVWSGANAANLLVDQLVPNPAIQDWNEILLNNPVQIDPSEELWIGYRANTQTGYPAGCDAGPAIAGFGDMIYFQGAWASMFQAYGLNYNWNIQGWISNTSRGDLATRVLPNPARANRGSIAAANYTHSRTQTDFYAYKHSNQVISTKNVNRALEMFKIFRMLDGQEENENLWTEIGTVSLPDTTFLYSAFGTLPSGVYRFAVKAIYTNNVVSPAALSNPLPLGMHAHVTMNINSNSGDSVAGAIVNLINHDGQAEHHYSQVVSANGTAIFPMVWKGTYTIDISLAGFQPHHNANVDILSNTVVYYAQLIEALLPVVNLQWEIANHNVTLSWLPPGESLEGDELEEGFEGGAVPAGWMAIDANNDGYNWFAYEYSPHGGAWSMASASWWQNVVLNPNNYLVTPQLELGGNQELRFWAAAQDPAYPADHYKVKLSTTGTTPANFNVVLFQETLANNVWHEVVIDLSAYAGQSVYLAWHHVDCSDEFVMKIDDISVLNVATREVTFAADFEELGNHSQNKYANPKYRETDNRSLLGYRIYRNGQTIVANTQATTYTDTNLPNGTYVYGVKAIYTTGSSETINTDPIALTSSEDIIVVEYVTALKGNYPNPFNPETVISYSLSEETNVSIDIYNVKGQKVKTLVNDIGPAGNYTVTWNGKDDEGQIVGSGIYFSKMRSGRYTSTKK
jgi:hypothetical protein